MLLRNESRVKHSIDIKLVFDDNTVKELEINENDFVQVSYKRNGCVKCGVGIIRKIKPVLRARCCDLSETAVITLDMSGENNACIDKIDLDDIIDINPLHRCCCKSHNHENQEHKCHCKSHNDDNQEHKCHCKSVEE